MSTLLELLALVAVGVSCSSGHHRRSQRRAAAVVALAAVARVAFWIARHVSANDTIEVCDGRATRSKVVFQPTAVALMLASFCFAADSLVWSRIAPIVAARGSTRGTESSQHHSSRREEHGLHVLHERMRLSAWLQRDMSGWLVLLINVKDAYLWMLLQQNDPSPLHLLSYAEVLYAFKSSVLWYRTLQSLGYTVRFSLVALVLAALTLHLWACFEDQAHVDRLPRMKALSDNVPIFPKVMAWSQQQAVFSAVVAMLAVPELFTSVALYRACRIDVHAAGEGGRNESCDA
eukprot:2268680-Prymnesium_polylepis.1